MMNFAAHTDIESTHAGTRQALIPVAYRRLA